MSDDAFERGMAIRKAVLGDEHVARAQANTTAFDAGGASAFFTTGPSRWPSSSSRSASSGAT